MTRAPADRFEPRDLPRRGRAAPQLLPPPPWAVRSVPEDGGITHERLSGVRPVVERWTRYGSRPAQTEVSLSAVDRLGPGGWMRATLTVQVEGGSYTVEGARQLRAALDELLAATCRRPDVG